MKSITTATHEFRCRQSGDIIRHAGDRRGSRIEVRDSVGRTEVARGFLSTKDERIRFCDPDIELRYVVTPDANRNKKTRLAASMTVADESDRPVMTLTWLDVHLFDKPFRIGRAVLAPSDLDDEILVVTACLAFSLYQHACYGTGGIG
jgi:hypothetical protein